jgi:hypothetical protein
MMKRVFLFAGLTAVLGVTACTEQQPGQSQQPAGQEDVEMYREDQGVMGGGTGEGTGGNVESPGNPKAGTQE